MTNRQLGKLVTRCLYDVARDLRGGALDPKLRFNEQFEFDSMDFLNFVTALHRTTGLELPERDHARLFTLEQAIACLAERLPG